MTRNRLATSIMTAVLLAVVFLTGCVAPSHASSARAVTPAPVIPLATGMTGSGGSWATVLTGGPSVGGKFWQLLVQGGSTGKWLLATPPGVADNAGLAVANAGDGAMTAGFIPSQLLRFTPLAVTADAGAHWSQGLFPAGLAGDPDSLAALPGGRLIAVTATAAQESASAASGWAPLATLRALAATQAGRRCKPVRLTGAGAASDGAPLLAVTCRRPGAVGLFLRTAAGGWQGTGPALPGSLHAGAVSVLGLAGSPAGTTVLLAATTSAGEALIPAWLAKGATRWATGIPLAVIVRGVTSAVASADGSWAVMLDGRQALLTEPAPGPSVAYNNLDSRFALPWPGATLVPGPARSVIALVPGVSTVTVWQQVHSRWRRLQVISVPSAPAGQAP